MDVKFEWVDGPTCTDAEWEKVEAILSIRGVMSLNRETTRILLAKDNDHLQGFIVFQLIPFLGPLYVAPSARGTGLSAKLADEMIDFLLSVKARGWYVIAQSPHTVKLCEERGFQKVQYPVYVASDPGGVEVEDAIRRPNQAARGQQTQGTQSTSS